MMTRIYRPVLLFIIFSWAFTQCDRNKDVIRDFSRYPTSLDNHWVYGYSVRFTQHDSNGNPSQEDTLLYSSDIIVQIVDDAFLINDSIETFSFQSYNIENPDWRSYQFYTNGDEGFLAHAYTSPGYNIYPKKSVAKFPVLLNNNPFEFPEPISKTYALRVPVSSDSLNDLKPPWVSLKYPMKLNSEWLYIENDAVKIQKSIDDITVIKTDAGKFECYEIQYNYLRSLLDSGVIDLRDYYANEGLIKRVIRLNPVRMGDPTGDYLTGESISVYKLKDYSLHR